MYRRDVKTPNRWESAREKHGERDYMSTETNVIKPLIPNNVADAIESFRSDRRGYADRDIVASVIATGSFVDVRLAALRSIPFDTLLAALVNDYERELTAEQRAHNKIQRMYIDRCYTASTGMLFEQTCRDRSFADGIRFTLDTLGVKITEVNA